MRAETIAGSEAPRAALGERRAVDRTATGMPAEESRTAGAIVGGETPGPAAAAVLLDGSSGSAREVHRNLPAFRGAPTTAAVIAGGEPSRPAGAAAFGSEPSAERPEAFAAPAAPLPAEERR